MPPEEATNRASSERLVVRPTGNAWLYWILANVVGHIAGISAFGIASLFVAWGSPDDIGSVVDLALPFAVLGLLDGLLVGLAQGLVLQYYTKRALLGEWTLFTGFGGIVAWVLGPVVGALAIAILGILFYVVAGGVAGVLVAYAQRPSVQRHLDPQASWLIPNMIAGALAVTVATIFSSLWGSTDGTSGIAGGVEVVLLAFGLGGLVYGAATARTFARMLDYYVARVNYGSDEPTEDISKIPVR